MPRRIKMFVVPGDPDTNRDAGKMYKITEMPATQGEKWATRAMLALVKAGIPLPDDVIGRGMESLAVAGFGALGQLSWSDLEPLMDEMFECVKIVRDKAHPETAFDLMEEDIEEIATRVMLRKEVFVLHTGFLKAAASSISQTSAASTSQSSAG